MIGVVILAHEQLRRTEQLALFLADQGCCVAIHIDARVKPRDTHRLTRKLGQHKTVVFVERRRCEWGTFSLVDASLDAIRLLFDRWPGISHVCQLSGACLPIKPIPALEAHLTKHANTDFIEAVSVEKDPWVVDGLSMERFTLYHPFSFRRNKWLFDRCVDVQRALRIRRSMPQGLRPYIGSQWWCLSAGTLRAILSDPMLPAYKAYFARTWIPDESFFQCMTVKHSDRIASKLLTFVHFDAQGKPYVFYDDHCDLLLHAEGFFARKVWRGADGLYKTFLDPALRLPAPGKDGTRLLRRFERAQRLHRHGRRGLINQGRHPGRNRSTCHETAEPYVVIDGLHRAFPGLLPELRKTDGAAVHGRLFAPDRVEFANDAAAVAGNLTANPAFRDHKPLHFLSKLVWAGRGRTQVFLHDFQTSSPINEALLADPNAHILRLSDGWLFDLADRWRHGSEAIAGHLPEAVTFPEDAAATLVSVTLLEVLDGGVEVADRLQSTLPLRLRGAQVFSGAEVPDDFATFLGDLLAVPGAPPDLADLAQVAARHAGMARLLRRKA